MRRQPIPGLLVLGLVLGLVVAWSPRVTTQARGGGPAPAGGAARYVDNGNDTVTDTQTGLTWEKKTTTVGSGVNPRDVRDVDNTYTWDEAMGDWLDRLNGRLINNANDTGFARYTDWRIPTLAELQTLVEAAAPGRINAIFGANGATYWSSSRRALGPPEVPWYVLFAADMPVYVGQPLRLHVRAVRGGRP